MPAKTISQLTQATTIASGDEFAIEQSGVTKRVAASVVRGDIANANISASAAIAHSKLANITAGQVLLGNASNVPTATALTGDVTVSSTGVATISAGAVITADIASAAVTPAKLSQPYTLASAQPSTSGTSIDFTGIPSWAKRVTVILSGVSLNSSSFLLIQVGAGSVTTSGYSGIGVKTNSSGTVLEQSGAGFSIRNGSGPSYITRAHVVLTLVSSNVWVSSHSGSTTDGTDHGAVTGGGSISLSGTLDRIRITTVNGTDTFDAGTINISYEG
jgi:hypothetical protein